MRDRLLARAAATLLAGASPAPGEVVNTRLLDGRRQIVGRLRGPSAEPFP